jgi:hypothetical protein
MDTKSTNGDRTESGKRDYYDRYGWRSAFITNRHVNYSIYNDPVNKSHEKKQKS